MTVQNNRLEKSKGVSVTSHKIISVKLSLHQCNISIIT